jgi:Domain of unknown function (DUF4412)
MRVSRFSTGLAAAILAAAPLAADQVLTLASHTDEMKMMGHTTPAKDEIHTYWFGESGVRYDFGDTSVIIRPDLKKFFFVNHPDKTVSAIDLPFDFKSLGGPEMAQMMEMMAKQMQASVTVTPETRTGSFAGFDCTYAHIDVKMMMMTMSTESCNSERMPIDFDRYKALQESFSQLAPNTDWIKEMTEKVKGFPVRSDTSVTVMGNEIKSWNELKSVEDKTPPAGYYDPPAGYTMKKYDPMAEMQKRQQRPH